MEHINDAGYTHRKGVCKGFKINTLRKYYDLYVQSNT